MTDQYFEECYFNNQDGLKQYYRDYGSPSERAEVMLCLPGLTRNSRDFSHVAEQFKDRFRVICVEQRGRGKSEYDPKPERYIPTTYVGDMFVLLNHLGVTQFHACGTSLGGLMTMLMQAANPGVVKSAIINDIGPEIDPAGIERIRGYVGATEPMTSWDEATNNMKQMASDVFPNFNNDDWRAFAQRIFVERDGKIVLDYDPALADTFKAASPDQAAPNLWPLFDSMKTVPMLVVRGATSDILSEKTLNDMGDIHPDMASVIVPDVGHAPSLTNRKSLRPLTNGLTASAPPSPKEPIQMPTAAIALLSFAAVILVAFQPLADDGDQQAIESAVFQYFDGYKTRDRLKLERAFASPDAQMMSVDKATGKLISRPIAKVIDGWVNHPRNRPELMGKILSVDISDGKLATVKFDFNGQYLDILTLAKTGDGWKIVNKLFFRR